jgi:hypothetical protein
LQINHRRKHRHRRQQVHYVGQALAVKRLFERARLVVVGEEHVEEGNDGALEFRPAARVDRVGREGLPDDGLADVGRDKERDARAEAVAFGEELVEEHDDERGGHELEDEEEADTGAERRGRAVHAREDVDGGLAEGDDEGED